MWEYFALYRGHDLWRSRDAEGKTIYAYTRRQEPEPRPPQARRGFYNLQTCKEAVRESIAVLFDSFCNDVETIRGRE